MRILDRYILKSVLRVFFGCLFTFLFLYIIIDIFSHLDEILKQRTNISILVQYYLAYLPIIFVQVSPIACLLATLYTFGKLNKDNEIIAMRASGLSIFQITKTVILFGVIVSLAVFAVNEKMAPQSLSLTEKIREQMESGKLKTKEEEKILSQLSIYGLKNRLFFINRFHSATDTIEGIVILEHDAQQNLTKKIVADKGIYNNGLWQFYKSITYNFDENGQMKGDPQYLEEETMDITETPREFLNQRQLPDLMNIAQLDSYIGKLSNSGATTVIRNLKVDLYKRFTDPITSVVIIFLGIPFALMMRKRATGLSSLGLSFMVGFLYYVLNAVSIALGKAGILIPILSASFAHILAFALGLYLINSLP
jgi:lipopolysaccharide export system permease protein